MSKATFALRTDRIATVAPTKFKIPKKSEVTAPASVLQNPVTTFSRNNKKDNGRKFIITKPVIEQQQEEEKPVPPPVRTLSNGSQKFIAPKANNSSISRTKKYDIDQTFKPTFVVVDVEPEEPKIEEKVIEEECENLMIDDEVRLPINWNQLVEQDEVKNDEEVTIDNEITTALDLLNL